MFWPLYILIIGLLVYLTIATVYLLILAAAFFMIREPGPGTSTKRNRFAILVPAHNEELLISRLCKSLLQIRYPRECHGIFIIADNCSDRTVEICKTFPVEVLIRNEPSREGKGFALHWALEQISLEPFDAVLIVDADNVVDKLVLRELNQLINQGESAIQCYNSIENRGDSWFTQLLFVSRTMNNLLYHYSKYKLGLSSYLMGNGICFSTTLLKEKGWTAFSAGEDWEYYGHLVADRIKVGFAAKAKVYHQESRSLNQATSQRLRWSGGKFQVMKTSGMKLFLKGLKEKDWFILDSSLALIFPNYSLQFNLTFLCLLISFFLPTSTFRTAAIVLGLALLSSQIVYFLTGVYLAKDAWKVCNAVLRAPIFLAWKLAIDILSMSGINSGKKWKRTRRHTSSGEIDPGTHPS
jgi:cellulose synthase/poly-beta-1,6-N-acetylglucosamine synthase-like glycosyltransferase